MENCRKLLENPGIISLLSKLVRESFPYCWKLLENCIIMYYIYEFNIFYIVAIWCIPDVFLMYSCYKFLLYSWKFHIICCIHIITTRNLLLKNCIIIYYIYEFNIFILLQYDVYLMYFWCIHVINFSYIRENFILSAVFILSRHVIPYVSP